MGEEDTWHGRRPLFVDFPGDNSLVAPFPWQGHVCLRNGGGYEWKCKELKDDEVDLPCQR